MSDQSTQQNPFTTRRFIVAVIVVGIIAICAVIVIISNVTGGNAKAKPGGSGPATSSSPVAASDPDPSTCGLAGYETSSSLTTAPKTTWQLVGVVAAPSDKTGAGPGVINSTGFRSCYAHTAKGALFSAANFTALGADATMRQQLASLVAPGAGHDAVEKQAAAGNANSSGVRAQVAGFKIDSYDAQNATVDLVLNYSDGQLASLPLKLTWSGGDWKLILTADGGLPLSPVKLQNLGGYIPWAGA